MLEYIHTTHASMSSQGSVVIICLKPVVELLQWGISSSSTKGPRGSSTDQNGHIVHITITLHRSLFKFLHTAKMFYPIGY